MWSERVVGSGKFSHFTKKEIHFCKSHLYRPKSHTRSASLDLHQMGRGRGGAPPSLPPRTASPCRDTTDGAGPGLEEGGGVTRDGRQISASIHKFKESIALLSRALAELGQEVNDTVEERVVLEYQLDQLKSIGNDEN